MSTPTPQRFGDLQHTPTGQNEQSEPKQPDLFDHAEDTRREAYEHSLKTARQRRDAVELAVAESGRKGLTDWDISQTVPMPYSSVQRPRGELVAAGRLRKTKRRRKTGNGGTAAVYVSALLAEGRHDGT